MTSNTQVLDALSTLDHFGMPIIPLTIFIALILALILTYFFNSNCKHYDKGKCKLDNSECKQEEDKEFFCPNYQEKYGHIRGKL